MIAYFIAIFSEIVGGKKWNLPEVEIGERKQKKKTNQKTKKPKTKQNKTKPNQTKTKTKPNQTKTKTKTKTNFIRSGNGIKKNLKGKIRGPNYIFEQIE